MSRSEEVDGAPGRHPGAGVVGSHARHDPRPDSDIDLVLLCSEPARYLRDTSWVSAFGEVASRSIENWCKVQSVRAFYRSGAEVEFGITGTDWAAVPADRGTAEVLENGFSILLDRDGLLLRLVSSTVRLGVG